MLLRQFGRRFRPFGDRKMSNQKSPKTGKIRAPYNTIRAPILTFQQTSISSILSHFHYKEDEDDEYEDEDVHMIYEFIYFYQKIFYKIKF